MQAKNIIRVSLLALSLFLGSASSAAAKTFATIYSSKGILYDIREKANLSGTGYESMQAGATDGTYAYYIFNKKNDRRSRLVKIRISDILKHPGRAYRKKSIAYNIGHANDMAYNPTTKCLYVLLHKDHRGKFSEYIAVFNSQTLRRKNHVRIKIPSSLPGATKKLRKRIKGFSSIGYNEKEGQYVLLISGRNLDFLILNSQFKAIRYVHTRKTTKYVNQGIDCTDQEIRVLRTRGGEGRYKNIIHVYTWKGKFKKTIWVRGLHFEGENIFHRGSSMYVSCTAYSKLLKPRRAAFISKLGEKQIVRKVRINKKRLVMKRGKYYRLKAKTYPRNAKNRRAVFRSLNTRVAKVSKRGLVHALRPGKAIIVAYSRDGYYTDYCRVRVR